jgi:rhamnogalacturonan endolyase
LCTAVPYRRAPLCDWYVPPAPADQTGGAGGVPASIVDNAGLEAPYKSLLNWSQAPLPPVGGGNPGGLTLTNLAVGDSANAANWSPQTNLQVGATVNGDRTHTFASLPAALVGAHWVRTANASKTATANQAATVYVGVDARRVDTGTTLTADEGGTVRSFPVFGKDFAAGPVALGPNGANTNMYTVSVV